MCAFRQTGAERTPEEIKPTMIARWLRKAKKMQWDYKNIVKRRGKLEKIGNW